MGAASTLSRARPFWTRRHDGPVSIGFDRDGYPSEMYEKSPQHFSLKSFPADRSTIDEPIETEGIGFKIAPRHAHGPRYDESAIEKGETNPSRAAGPAHNRAPAAALGHPRAPQQLPIHSMGCAGGARCIRFVTVDGLVSDGRPRHAASLRRSELTTCGDLDCLGIVFCK